MTATADQQQALGPLWWFSGALMGSICSCLLLDIRMESAIATALLAVAAFLLLTVLRVDPKYRVVLMVAVGLATGFARGGNEAAQSHGRSVLFGSASDIAVRVKVRILEGWRPSRWGTQTSVRVEHAQHNGLVVGLPRRCRLEVRNSSPSDLPKPGATVTAVARLRGQADHPLIVVGSPRLLEKHKDPRGPAAWRDHLAKKLFVAAGVDSERIRAAELAAGLALGRKDLIPRDTVDGWRRSGLAHALAVSGLHVGVVAGFAWFLAALAGCRPRRTRLVLLVVLPCYAVMAGSSPSAVRATVMIVVYLAARQLGRNVFPLAALLLASNGLLIVNPSLLTQPGFQLTVGVTAALIRWVPPLVKSFPLPAWLGAAAAVPLVAQVAAAPIIAGHFRALTPFAALVNLTVPIALLPAIPLAVACTVVAGVMPWIAALGLDLLGLLTGLLWWVGTIGRSWTLLTPSLPLALTAILGVTAWLTLRIDRISRFAGLAWIVMTAGVVLYGVIPAAEKSGRVTLLPVDDGLAAIVATGDVNVLFDGGRRRQQAAELLADARIGSPQLVIASHGDEDHIGGLETIIRSDHPSRMLLPSWMMSFEGSVPLLRAARRRGIRVTPVSRGAWLRQNNVDIVTLWPPQEFKSESGNDRSLVVRVRWPNGRVLLTADIGQTIERRLVNSTDVSSDVMIVPHHGSRGSSSMALFHQVNPSIALIPAGPKNRNNHPHSEVLHRLDELGIDFRYPMRDGLCGARFSEGVWLAWPETQQN